MFIDPVLQAEMRDGVLILGDSNSSLAAIAAKRRHMPIVHMEAGNRCFDERVPGETNRHIVDHIADVNMPDTAIAREHSCTNTSPLTAPSRQAVRCTKC